MFFCVLGQTGLPCSCVVWGDLLLFLGAKVVDPAPVLPGEICFYFEVEQVDPALVLPGEILFAFLSLSLCRSSG